MNSTDSIAAEPRSFGRIHWFIYASPQAFYPVAGKMIPWFATAAVALTALGPYLGFFVAPTDHQPGDAYRIVFLHAPAAWLVLSAFPKNLVFFFTPTQILAREAPRGRSFRVGGMVENGSPQRQADGITVSFIVTDTAQRVRVNYRGILPDLFKEGKGVVAQGTLGAENVFVAEQVLAKHDENHMPPDAGYALKQGKQISRNISARPKDKK